MRMITAAARVNLAAANYHYGDKQSLFLEVISNRMRAINQARLSSLDQAEARAGDGLVPLATLVELLAQPLFALCQDGDVGGAHAARLIGRCMTEPNPLLEEIVATEIQPVMGRFGQALRRHAPTMPPEDFLWRLSFVAGSLHHSLATLHCMSKLTRGFCRDNDGHGALRRFIPFAVGALTCGAPSGSSCA